MLKNMGIGIDITVKEEEGIHFVHLDGRLDAATTPVLEKKLAKLLDASSRLAIDFTDVGYLSSAGMRLLLSIAKKMHAKEGKAVFYGMSDDVFEIIKMAGFERILTIEDSKKDVLKHF